MRDMLAILILTVAAGCGTPERPLPTGSPLTPLDGGTLIQIASEELGKVDAEPAQRARALASLRAMLADPEVARTLRGRVTAVGAFRAGGGGILLGGASGQGRVAFGGLAWRRRITLDGWSFGAQLGGAEVVGVLLAVGLEQDELLEDAYRMRSTGGTFVQAGTVHAEGDAQRGRHRLHIVGSGTGLGADASLGQLRITFTK